MNIKDRIQEIFDKQQKRAILLRTEKIEKRYDRLKKLRKWIYTKREKIQKAIHEDFKKPFEETDITEIAPCILELNHAMKYLDQWTAVERVKGHISYLGASGYVQYEPKGVCLIISPWNYPFSLAVGPLVSAMAAGNTAIIKPSEMTPHTSALINSMVGELYDEAEVYVFEGSVDVSQALLSQPFNHMFFTGSTNVGKIVMEAAAKHLASVTLELGGKSPVIVDETAYLKDAAKRIAWGKLVNNGQTCV
ncbi:MAG: aldehyde dehydrogenase family protein, partial [Cyclobacteriaceae bacterium]